MLWCNGEHIIQPQHTLQRVDKVTSKWCFTRFHIIIFSTPWRMYCIQCRNFLSSNMFLNLLWCFNTIFTLWWVVFSAIFFCFHATYVYFFLFHSLILIVFSFLKAFCFAMSSLSCRNISPLTRGNVIQCIIYSWRWCCKCLGRQTVCSWWLIDYIELCLGGWIPSVTFCCTA